MLSSVNWTRDHTKTALDPGSAVREELLLPSTALELTPLLRQYKFTTTTTLPTEEWSCKHAPHQRKKK